ncbi:MAG TPA: hypothetical protein VH089_28665 [Streptosporangiaceae bacterium]|nr:hypothetical protein [Streptosporangiaceae bacterium]
MRSGPTRTATFARAALLVSLAVVPLAACSSPHHHISTSAGAPRQPAPSVRGTGAASAAPVPVHPSGTAAGGVAVAAGPGSTAVAGSGSGSGGSGGASGISGSAAALAPGHAGSVTVADLRPVRANGTATAPVTCEAAGSTYVALISKAAAGGLVHSFTVRVSGYHGSGQYRGTLSATVTGTHGTVASLTGASAVTVAVTKTGGTFRINVTGSGDHTLDTTVKWVCPLDS